MKRLSRMGLSSDEELLTCLWVCLGIWVIWVRLCCWARHSVASKVIGKVHYLVEAWVRYLTQSCQRGWYYIPVLVLCQEHQTAKQHYYELYQSFFGHEDTTWAAFSGLLLFRVPSFSLCCPGFLQGLCHCPTLPVKTEGCSVILHSITRWLPQVKVPLPQKCVCDCVIVFYEAAGHCAQYSPEPLKSLPTASKKVFVLSPSVPERPKWERKRKQVQKGHLLSTSTTLNLLSGAWLRIASITININVWWYKLKPIRHCNGMLDIK